jgi:hypothetical protein
VISQEQVELALGSKRAFASQELVTTLNALETDGADLVRENWLTHANILREGTYSMDQYLAAIKYVSLKQMGHTNQQAYSIALSERYQELVAKGYDEQRISSHVAAYHKGQLIQKLLAQSTIPLYMLYQDEAHKAIKVLVDVMESEKSSQKTKAEAANMLLTQVKRPEAAKIELDVTHKQADGMGELMVMMRDLAAKQLKAIEEGANVKTVANLGLNKREPILIEATKVE